MGRALSRPSAGINRIRFAGSPRTQRYLSPLAGHPSEAWIVAQNRGGSQTVAWRSLLERMPAKAGWAAQAGTAAFAAACSASPGVPSPRWSGMNRTSTATRSVTAHATRYW